MTFLTKVKAEIHSENDIVYSSGNGRDKKIALTFDDGPHPRYTPQILDILEKYNIKATFFIIGQNAGYYPEVLNKVIEAGHELGNHTYFHRDLSKANEDIVLDEIISTENEIEERVGYTTKILRPPGGLYGLPAISIAEKLDYRVILWTLDTKDWQCPPAKNIVKNVLKNIKGGDIILMHDYVSGKSQTPEALRSIIPALLANGYEFVTISELISSES